MTQAEWSTLSDAARILFPLVGTGIGGWIVSLLRGIRADMKDFNDRIIALERDHEAHRQLDDARFEALQREVDQHRLFRVPNNRRGDA